jgi:hypothetical protein
MRSPRQNRPSPRDGGAAGGGAGGSPPPPVRLWRLLWLAGLATALHVRVLSACFALSVAAGGRLPLDLRPPWPPGVRAWSLADARALFDALGPAGRTRLVDMHAGFDIAFPLACVSHRALFFVVFACWGGVRGRVAHISACIGGARDVVPHGERAAGETKIKQTKMCFARRCPGTRRCSTRSHFEFVRESNEPNPPRARCSRATPSGRARLSSSLLCDRAHARVDEESPPPRPAVSRARSASCSAPRPSYRGRGTLGPGLFTMTT